ncbi:hypothetical protein ACIQT3_10925 [Enterobacter sichuanensis]|uniref:hypothetical protein n=1 Tax=Enterobacter sichuanensis TaxID=2071710 RepID=UPI00383BAEC0
MSAESLPFHGEIEGEPLDVKLATFEWLALYSESIFDQRSADFRRYCACEYKRFSTERQEEKNV